MCSYKKKCFEEPYFWANCSHGGRVWRILQWNIMGKYINLKFWIKFKAPEKLLNLNIECQQVNGLCVNMSNDCTLNACKHLLCNWHVLIEGLNPNWNHLYKNYTDLSIALNDVLLEKKPWQFYAFSVTEWDFVVKQLLPTVHRLLSEHTVSVGALWVSVGHPPILSACPSLFQRWWCTTSPTELVKCLQKCRKLS